MDVGQSVWREHEPHLRGDEPHQRLRWQLLPRVRGRHRTHEHVRRQLRARIRRRNGAHERLRWHHVWRLWRGATHTYASVATAYHPPGSVPYAGYPAYHPPVAVPYYSASGCYGCAAAAGAVVGVAAGAAVASASAAAASSNAYNAGVAAGAAAASTPAVYAMGVNYATVPAGCAPAAVQGTTFYVCGNTWFQPIYGANGVYYRVVPTP